MKSKLTTMVKAAIGLTALAGSQVAQAQQCLNQDDLAEAVVYLVPVLGASFKAKCGPSLSSDGFVADGLDTMIARFEPLQAGAFPAALRVLAVFASRDESAQEMLALTQGLPPEALQPLVDALIAGEFNKSIKLSDCANIERGVSLLAPLPPENVGGLVSFLMDVSGVKNPTVCAYRPAP